MFKDKRKLPILLLIYLLNPVFVFGLISWLFLDFNGYKLKVNFTENICLALIAYIFITLENSIKFRKYIFWSIYILLSLKIFIDLSYYNLYGNSIGPSTIYILMETNLTEVFEYFQANSSFFSICIIALLVWPHLIPYKHRDIKLNFLKFELNNLFLIYILIGTLFLYFFQNLYIHNFYYKTWTSYKSYVEQSKLFDHLGLHNKIGKFKHVTSQSNPSKQLYVVVIGESTTRHKMGLYGYKRKTTPLLSSLDDELKVYTDVISPATHTIPSLSELLTGYDLNKTHFKGDGSLIQLMNQAGFNTYWISNQRPVGLNENLITKLASASTKTYFLNINNYNLTTPYDNVVLLKLQELLSQDLNKTFIIIHLLGTHAYYKNRYPESFNKFNTGSDFVKTLNDSENEIVIEYDNAILYNDYIVYNIIQKVKSLNLNSYVLYLSDHGEDVFEINHSASHTETNGTKPMYDIPFVLWTSKKYNKTRSIDLDLHRPYMLNDLIYSIADLSKVSFLGYLPKRSIFNKRFIARNRIIFDSINYDKHFKP